MNRRLSASVLAALGAAALIASCAGREPRQPVVDQAAVDRYVAGLAAAERARSDADKPVALSGKIPPEDSKIRKEAVGRADRAEPVLGAVAAFAR